MTAEAMASVSKHDPSAYICEYVCTHKCVVKLYLSGNAFVRCFLATMCTSDHQLPLRNTDDEYYEFTPKVQNEVVGHLNFAEFVCPLELWTHQNYRFVVRSGAKVPHNPSSSIDQVTGQSSSQSSTGRT